MYILSLLITIISAIGVITIFILAQNKEEIWNFIKDNYISDKKNNRRK